MSVFSDVRINGVTGGMTMNSLGRVERKLDWAVIKNGIAELKTETLNAQLP
jgi:outer membrane PBP1 activator LpoA protein